LLPYLDWAVIRANPKLLIGFSDITAMHMAFAAPRRLYDHSRPGAAATGPSSPWMRFVVSSSTG
jgi:muramoyltetrapeptide carboxypeptidase